jgi:hypothetical protein
MKSNWLLALSYLVIGMTAFTGKIAYAEMHSVGMYEQPAYCADWNFNDPNCSAYLTEPSGKAAFGEPSGVSMRAESTRTSCNDWSFNTPGCPAYLSRAEGKAAFGEPTTHGFEPAAYCADWDFTDPMCTADIRKYPN